MQTKNLLGPCSLSPQLSHPSFTSGLLRQPFQWQPVNSDVALTVDNVFLSAYVVLVVSCELLEFALASATAIINLRDKKKANRAKSGLVATDALVVIIKILLG